MAAESARGPDTTVPATMHQHRFTHVLCAIDGSPESLLAIQQAHTLAPEAQLYGVAVLDPGDALPVGTNEGRTQCETWLRQAEREFPGLDTKLVSGRAVDTLVNLATTDHVDLIAVGASESSRAAGTVHSSVTTGLGHRAPCSLLVSRPVATFPEPIVLATDGSENSLAACEVAADIAAGSERAVVLVNVGDGSGAADLSEHATRVFERSRTEAVVVMTEGDPGRRIVEAADRAGAGLLVVGSRGRTGLKRLGSVSEHVLHHSHSSVLVVRG